ncbi:UvrD-helicase domain-containing protein [Xanthomonas arboricola]|uniref:UvrD-helicase domain-containing protein n=1 Tax=Xanthomonas arboricola TaxID=56448 RepID=UPI00069FD4A0|nr:exodeoxyribonuclease V subunit beta [Xanthomonas arboricola]KOB07164.1 exodeoxyribonuclease V subunit beta [Xanthomonas arboricola]KOB12230.1 exodeoxyribonuclease V subunit beta [Xanthomonas arboricola]KOB21253.1 exodeoxyribonuclease V subunit beta [Xanthomonas arboricola]KOB36940.1 exodeoxyribonuclease V subunit beta [Xanthomonas arboricola]KOB47013.1 exodeoxyribonuclease V subunit beta [Xanthomonas arboricola]
MSASPVTDPYLHLPLHGVRLIEASAGTGKTFTLATLFTRLVVERGLRIGQILAVTFTEAATQELRRRIRERLVLAATLVPDAPVGAARAATDLADDPSRPGPLLHEAPDAFVATHLAPGTETPTASVGAARAATDLADDPSRPGPLLHEAPDAFVATHLATDTETPTAPVGAARAATDLANDPSRPGPLLQDAPDAFLATHLAPGTETPTASVGAARAATDLADDPSRPGPLLQDAPDVLLTRAVLATHLANGTETPAALRRRLQQAVEEIDLAAVFTIHGFCARVLREHALESGQAFAAPELLANDRELLGEVAADLWRQRAADAAMAEDLIALWSGGPEALASDLRALVRHPTLLPAAATTNDDSAALLQAVQDASTALAAAFHAHGTAFFDTIMAAIDGGILSKVSYKPEWLTALWHWFDSFVAAPSMHTTPHAKLIKLTAAELAAGTNKKFVDRTPASPLSHEIDGYLTALAGVEAWRSRRRIRLLHALREDAIARLALLKRQRRVQTYDDLVDGVAHALEGAQAQAQALVTRLRAQYAIALVDEFQDTDDRQWAIFSNVFGEGALARAAGLEPALFLIGDPKQAIYGFRGGDVRTYLAAAVTAELAPPLSHNFRSRPGVLAAIDALYAQAGYTDAFLTDGIAFHPVRPGTKRVDADLQRDGGPAPALTLWRAPEPPPPIKGKPKPWSANRARELATAACVAAIRGWLAGGRDGTATVNGRPVQAGDIAVLVRSHGEATRMQQALGAVGIPAVAAGKQSLFATDEALELLALLQALLDPGDDSRLRAALATVLIGADAAAIAALAHDGERHRRWQQQALDWRERWQRGGPLALIGDLGAAHGQRLLALVDGERRLTNYLQLAELLQEADARALGPHGLVDWLSRRIANADDNDEAQQLRLESDARRVQIVTLHKSKGLEYPLVFLPYIGIGRSDKGAGRHCVVHAPELGRQLHWKTDKDDPTWSAAEAAWKQEQRAEDARLLYVGLTRAEHALWIASGPFHQHERTALSGMLRALDALQGAAGEGAVVVDTSTPPANLPRLPPPVEAQVPPARAPQRHIAPDWWVYSFTQLANADAGAATDPMASATVVGSGGSDEPSGSEAVAVAAEVDAFDPRFAGNRFGVVMHDVFERCDFAAWQAWRPGLPAPEGQAAAILEALQRGGYVEKEWDDGLAMLTALIGHTLTVALPEGTTLAAVPAPQRRNEMEFHFAMRPTRVDALLALLHRFGVVGDRQAFGARQRLEGLMTGLIDLTYTVDGRWYVLDYKSNRLPSYDADALARAMAHSEYELQALIYTVALHRWLRFRLGDGYDYARDFGGVRYLFCRGLDATRNPAADSSSIPGSGSGSGYDSRSDSVNGASAASDSDLVNGASSISDSGFDSDADADAVNRATPAPGIHAWRFDPALVQALDALFAGSAPEPTSSNPGTPDAR